MDNLFGGEEWEDTAQICLNGHPINSTAGSNPNLNRDFCERCGQKTILECPTCRTRIRGYRGTEAPGIAYTFEYEPPAYCHKCGSAFPWTEKSLNSAKALAAELEGLTEEERRTLAESIEDLVHDSPGTALAATRFKKLLAKVKGPGGAALWEIVKTVASEAAKRILLPGP